MTIDHEPDSSRRNPPGPPVSLACALALLLFGTSLSAQDDRTGQETLVLRFIFGRADANGDGVVEVDEFPGSEEQFREVDRNRNKKVDFEEFERSAMANDLIAARRANDLAPRPRLDPIRLRMERLQNLRRFDRNGNGTVERDEWNGAERDFRDLDLDSNGRLDKRDRALAARAAARALPADPEFRRPLGTVDEVLEESDGDRDGRIDRREAQKSDLAQPFDWADQNLDGHLDRSELQRLVRKSREVLEARRLGSARPRAFRPPFSAWDEDNNGRLETAEFKERKYLFSRIDQDRDAAITEVEIERYIRAVERTGFLDRFDLDDDGRVTAKEFGGPPGAFRRADKDGDGKVTRRDR